MVRAILEGNKTQTRRVMRDQVVAPGVLQMAGPGYCEIVNEHGVRIPGFRCPYGQPGDRLWVRESFSGPWCMEAHDGLPAVPPSKWGKSSIWYWADGEPAYGDWTRPRPSIHMPRSASRITLEITGVRVERLQDISVGDCIAEGIPRGGPENPDGIEKREYRALWESINGPGSWEANPSVWVVSFRQMDAATSAADSR